MEYSLTTGQMLDRLKVGEIAESRNKRHVIKSPHLIHNQSVYPCDPIGRIIENHTLYLNKNFLNENWRILPKFVSFEEALEAYKEGCLIESYIDNLDEPWAGYSKKATIEQTISFKEIIDGKWRIKADLE